MWADQVPECKVEGKLVLILNAANNNLILIIYKYLVIPWPYTELCEYLYYTTPTHVYKYKIYSENFVF